MQAGARAGSSQASSRHNLQQQRRRMVGMGAGRMADNPTVNPQGQAAPLTPQQIDALATITPSVIADAKADARRTSPQLFAMLNAVPVDAQGRPIVKRSKRVKRRR